jgi:hypothetical protein
VSSEFNMKSPAQLWQVAIPAIHPEKMPDSSRWTLTIRLLIQWCYWAFSFNGEPQAEAKLGSDACGLPLNVKG